jgi:hypothetical protein
LFHQLNRALSVHEVDCAPVAVPIVLSRDAAEPDRLVFEDCREADFDAPVVRLDVDDRFDVFDRADDPVPVEAELDREDEVEVAEDAERPVLDPLESERLVRRVPRLDRDVPDDVDRFVVVLEPLRELLVLPLLLVLLLLPVLLLLLLPRPQMSPEGNPPIRFAT